jgi:hypothetical protein
MNKISTIKIGSIMESKSNNWISTGKASFLTSLYTQYSAFSVCSTSFFFVSKNVPLYLNITPMYEILIYGSEAWGYENLKFIEQIHLKYCKRVLQVRNITANFMVLGEPRRFPIEVKVKLRMISFWSRLIQSDLMFGI